ncbi:hypothetical protein GCM10023094_03100 [Rhodococcus olei]|uniref:Protoporphyrinogen oxidase n=1 Tax=Rhodococcus olei TaxID=2161675 RepID=A0ABP8NVN6_9NOCA
MRNQWPRLMIGAAVGAAMFGAFAIVRRRSAAALARPSMEHPVEGHTPDIHPAELAADVREKLPQHIKKTASRVAESPIGEATRHAGQVVAKTARQAEKHAEEFAKNRTHRDGHNADQPNPDR